MGKEKDEDKVRPFSILSGSGSKTEEKVIDFHGNASAVLINRDGKAAYKKDNITFWGFPDVDDDSPLSQFTVIEWIEGEKKRRAYIIPSCETSLIIEQDAPSDKK